MTAKVSILPGYYEPDLATKLQMCLKISSRPDYVLTQFIEKTRYQRACGRLVRSEINGLCSVAMEIYSSTRVPKAQLLCLALILETLSREGIDRLEMFGLGDALNSEVRSAFHKTLRALRNAVNHR
jgi:hypothetical protein